MNSKYYVEGVSRSKAEEILSTSNMSKTVVKRYLIITYDGVSPIAMTKMEGVELSTISYTCRNAKAYIQRYIKRVPGELSKESDVYALGLPSNVYRILKNNGITTIGQCQKLSNADLLEMSGMGDKRINLIYERLRVNGFRTKIKKINF